MPSIATVTTRVFATFAARIPLPKSICEMIQPPKMSPLGFVSAGIAIVRITNSPLGFSAIGPEPSEGASEDQHAVAVTVKAVALPDRFLVGLEDELAPGKCAHQHKQSRARQMEVRQEHIDMADLHRRINENSGGAALRGEPA